MDSSSIISLSSTCLLWILEKLPFEFYISPFVEYEVIERAMQIERYRWSGIRILELVKKGVLRYVGVRKEKEAHELLKIANSIYSIRGKRLRILHRADAEVMLLAKDFDGFVTDEKTMRLLVEDPSLVRKLLELKFKERVSMDEGKVEMLRKMVGDVDVFRSADLVAYAFKHGLMRRWEEIYGREILLDGLLHALRRAGCAIAESEIKEYKEILA